MRAGHSVIFFFDCKITMLYVFGQPEKACCTSSEKFLLNRCALRFNSIHVLDNTLTVKEVSSNLIYCVIASWWAVFFLFVASPCIAWNYYGQDLLVSSSWILAYIKASLFFLTPIPQVLSCRSAFLKIILSRNT